MFPEFKRTFQQTEIPELFLYAVIAATTSIHLTNFHYLTQFSLATIVTVSIFFFNKKIRENKNISKYLIPLITGLTLSINFFTSLLASVFILSLFFVPSIFFKDLKLPLIAILSHAVDVFSTRLILPRGSELNPVANYFISLSPEFGLPILKLFFVVAPVIWSMKNLEKAERLIFLKLVFILGAGMAIRNLTIILH